MVWGQRSAKLRAAGQSTIRFWASISRGNSGDEVVATSEPGGMCRGISDDGGVRRRRWHLAKSGAGTNSGTHTNPDTDSYADPDSYPDADSYADAERRNDVHDYVRRCLTTIADRTSRNPCDVHQQRHAGARNGLRSTSGPYRLSGDQSG